MGSSLLVLQASGYEILVMADRMLIASIVIFFITATAFAGPPFLTDDPEPVEYKHWEIYVASQGSFDRNATSLTAPHIEVNYGVFPNIQIHLIAPLEYVKQEGKASHYGYADMELGAKFRFIQETDLCPQIGVFPLVELPTGNKNKELGNGETQVFLPLWVQKDWEPWVTYGGGGYWINPGTGNKNYWFFGWELQRDMTKHLTLGAEVFHQTVSETGGESNTGFNVGAIINFNDLHHVLLSGGSNISGPNNAAYYIGYQLTFGP